MAKSGGPEADPSLARGQAEPPSKSDRRRALFPFLGVLLLGLAAARVPGTTEAASRTPEVLAPARLLAPLGGRGGAPLRVLELDARTSRLELARTQERFDLVTLSFVEQPGSRFVATVEGLRAAKRLLAPGGAFALVAPGEPQWLYERADVTLSEAFQAAPRVLVPRDAASHGILFLQGVPESTAPGPDIREARLLLGPTASLATDDWPYYDRPGRALAPRERLELGGGLALGLLLAVTVVARKGKAALPLLLLGCGLALTAARALDAGELLLGSGEKPAAATAAGLLGLALAGSELAIRRGAGRSRLLAWLLAGSLVAAFWAPHEAVLLLGLVLASVLGGAAVPAELPLALGVVPALGALLAGGSAGFGLGRLEVLLGLRALPALALLAISLGLALARRGARHA